MNHVDLTRCLLLERRFSYNVFNALPRDRGDYRPETDMRSVVEQLSHIGAMDNYLVHGIQLDDWAFDIFTDRPEKTIEEALAYLDYSRQRLLQMIEELKDEGLNRPVGPNPAYSEQIYVGNVIQMSLYHECHHRGQLVVYLRMMGVVPPNLYAV